MARTERTASLSLSDGGQQKVHSRGQISAISTQRKVKEGACKAWLSPAVYPRKHTQKAVGSGQQRSSIAQLHGTRAACFLWPAVNLAAIICATAATACCCSRLEAVSGKSRRELLDMWQVCLLLLKGLGMLRLLLVLPRLDQHLMLQTLLQAGVTTQ